MTHLGGFKGSRLLREMRNPWVPYYSKSSSQQINRDAKYLYIAHEIEQKSVFSIRNKCIHDSAWPDLPLSCKMYYLNNDKRYTGIPVTMNNNSLHPYQYNVHTYYVVGIAVQ